MTNESTEDRAPPPEFRQPDGRRESAAANPDEERVAANAARTAVELARERILARARRAGVR